MLHRSVLSHPAGLLSLVSALLLAACGGQDRPADAPDASQAEEARPESDSRADFAIATANPHATEAGAAILRQGGSAVDAAIAVQAVLGLVEPQSSGFGGGAFMLYYDAESERVLSFDGREMAPASATPDMFLNEDGSPMDFYDAVTGGRSVGVPGVVAMLAMAHERFGTLSFSQTLEPARALASEGFAVSPRLHGLIVRMSEAGRLDEGYGARDYFFTEDGAPLPVGYELANPAYAETLQTMQEMGPAAFYAGILAEDIAATVNEVAGPGTMQREDLSSYVPETREPVCADYRDKTVCSMGPPSSGGVTVLQILGLLEETPFAEAAPRSAEAWHLLMEASRLAYADRNLYLADPAFMAIGNHDAASVVDALLAPDYITRRAALIAPDTSAGSVTPGQPFGDPDLGVDGSPEPPSTSHFSIVDARGNVVSMTTSVETAFGSHIMAAGMILNNQLTDFSFIPERDGSPVVNAPLASKRPRSSMAPVIILNEDGSVYAALGSPGGPAIIGYVAKTIVGMIDWDLSLQEAIELPNVVIPRGEILAEDGRLDAATVQALAGFGMVPRVTDLNSGVHGIVLTEDGFAGGADSRREGTVLRGRVEMTEAAP